MAPKLSNQKEVLRFLGMIDFNRRFIANLGKIADPLYGLLKNGVSADAWPWDQRCQDACIVEPRTRLACDRSRRARSLHLQR
eukprot:4617315-Pleurochrysis_carterae.AAC.1